MVDLRVIKYERRKSAGDLQRNQRTGQCEQRFVIARPIQHLMQPLTKLVRERPGFGYRQDQTGGEHNGDWRWTKSASGTQENKSSIESATSGHQPDNNEFSERVFQRRKRIAEQVAPAKNRQRIKERYGADSEQLDREKAMAGRHRDIIGTGQNVVNCLNSSRAEPRFLPLRVL